MLGVVKQAILRRYCDQFEQRFKANTLMSDRTLNPELEKEIDFAHRTPARRDGRVVEGTGLENRQAGDRLVGSNPTPSANYCQYHIDIKIFSNLTISTSPLKIPLQLSDHQNAKWPVDRS